MPSEINIQRFWTPVGPIPGKVAEEAGKAVGEVLKGVVPCSGLLLSFPGATTVGLIRAARSAGTIRSKEQCLQIASDSNAIGKYLGKIPAVGEMTERMVQCSCEYVFGGEAEAVGSSSNAPSIEQQHAELAETICTMLLASILRASRRDVIGARSWPVDGLTYRLNLENLYDLLPIPGAQSANFQSQYVITFTDGNNSVWYSLDVDRGDGRRVIRLYFRPASANEIEVTSRAPGQNQIVFL